MPPRAGASPLVALRVVWAFVLSGLLAFACFIGHAPRGHVLMSFLNQGEAAALFSFIFLHIVAAGGGAWSVDAWRASGRGAVGGTTAVTTA